MNDARPTARAGDPGATREWRTWLARASRSPRIREAAWVVLTMATSVAVAAWVYRLWEAPLRIPLAASGVGDTFLALAGIKGLLENGWVLSNPALGAPLGLSNFDFAGLNGDGLQWMALRVLGLGISDPAILLNTYFLLGFALVGAASFIVLRNVGVSRLTGFALSVFFANMSFHFTHGEGHLMLAGYFAVPAGCWLVLRVLTGRPLVRRGARSGLLAWATPATGGTLAAVIVVGGSTLYYAVFTVILLAIATPLRAIATRSWRGLAPGIGALAGIGIVLLVNLGPALIHRLANGPNTATAARTAIESEMYSFSLTRLLLMTAGHRIPQLSDLGNSVASQSLTTGEGEVIGLVTGGTFIVMLVMLGIWIIRGHGARGATGAVINASVLSAVAVFLIGTTGGLSGVIANVISPQIRAWGRLTPFLVFFCIVVLALGIDWARRRIGTTGPRRLLGSALPVVIGVLAVLDQTSPSNVPDYTANAARWAIDDAFVKGIEREVPAGSSVLQLPLHPFPEAGPVGEMEDYDHLAGYVHSDNLRWSYGAMRGRPGDWSESAADLPVPQLLRYAIAAGFNGVWVDRDAYEDHGARLESAIRRTLGPSAHAVVSEDQRRAFYGFGRYGAAVRRSLSPDELGELALALTRPVTATYGPGFYGEERGTGLRWRWATRDATMTITNPTGRRQAVTWSAELRASPGTRVTITAGGRLLARRVLSRGVLPVSLRIASPPGTIEVRFRSDGANNATSSDPRDLYLQVLRPTLVTDRVAAALGTTVARRNG